jgi:hypothetical protein
MACPLNFTAPHLTQVLYPNKPEPRNGPRTRQCHAHLSRPIRLQHAPSGGESGREGATPFVKGYGVIQVLSEKKILMKADRRQRLLYLSRLNVRRAP